MRPGDRCGLRAVPRATWIRGAAAAAAAAAAECSGAGSYGGRYSAAGSCPGAGDCSGGGRCSAAGSCGAAAATAGDRSDAGHSAAAAAAHRSDAAKCSAAAAAAAAGAGAGVHSSAWNACAAGLRCVPIREQLSALPTRMHPGARRAAHPGLPGMPGRLHVPRVRAARRTWAATGAAGAACCVAGVRAAAGHAAAAGLRRMPVRLQLPAVQPAARWRPRRHGGWSAAGACQAACQGRLFVGLPVGPMAVAKTALGTETKGAAKLAPEGWQTLFGLSQTTHAPPRSAPPQPLALPLKAPPFSQLLQHPSRQVQSPRVHFQSRWSPSPKDCGQGTGRRGNRASRRPERK